ncbi:hypothetical protein AEQU_0634 [Adlercreutzia equolifaciens DSM 19450]|nr:hypothetical protein AEQU_0634 [Adlercreutzia equolifaciens DSM 19450]
MRLTRNPRTGEGSRGTTSVGNAPAHPLGGDAASPACSRSVTGAPGTPTGRLAGERSRSGMLLGRE